MQISKDQQEKINTNVRLRNRSGHREGLHPEAENKTERERERERETEGEGGGLRSNKILRLGPQEIALSLSVCLSLSLCTSF